MNFCDKIGGIEKFSEHFKVLQILSVQNQLGLGLSYPLNGVDLPYLLTAASILAQSDEGNGQDAALRIAQTILTLSDDKELKNAAAVVLHTLTNNPAIELAIQRKLVNMNYIENVPIPLRFDMIKRNLKYKINTQGTKECYLNKFQFDAYNAFLEVDRLSISAPTSAGKSFLLQKMVLDSIILNNAKEIVYIVPTRALIQQVEIDLEVLLKENLEQEFEVSVIPLATGQAKGVRVFVFTQERFQWLLNDYPEFMPDVVFVDEAQKISDNARGIILENVINEITSKNPKVKMIFASPMTSNPEKLLRYNTNDRLIIKKIIGEFTAVNQNLIWVHQDPLYTAEWKIDFCINSEMANIGKVTMSNTKQIKHRVASVSHRLSSAKSGSMVFVHGKADAEDISYLLYQLEPEDEEKQELKDLIDLIKKGIHKDYLLAEVLRRGVAFHYGDMPLIVKSTIEKLFKEGLIKILVCTSTLLEGVNLPASSIFIRGMKKGKKTFMTPMDFWNLAGRAGRQRREFQGNIICIDSDDEIIWDGVPPKTKEKYEIISVLDEIIANQTSNFIDFIRETDTGKIFKNSDYAHVLSYVINEKIKAGKLVDSDLARRFNRDIINSIDTEVDILLGQCKEIPIDVISKNIGVHPRLQLNLYRYFCDYWGDVESLIPPLPTSKNALTRYRQIVSCIHNKLIGISNIKLDYKRALVAVNWMRGYGLARIISENIRYSAKALKAEKTQTIIRRTMEDIEQWARFQFVKYVSCYNKLLLIHLKKIDKTDLIQLVPEKDMNIWLEFGATLTTQISLMGLGLSRSAALEISEKMIEENMNPDECLKWLQNENIEILEINKIYKDEIKSLIDRNAKVNN